MARIRLEFRELELLENEDTGSCHMALYATVTEPSGTREVFRWNNFATEVDEVETYRLDNDPNNPNDVYVNVSGKFTLKVQGWNHDDAAWPSKAKHQNDLGSVSVVIDPNDVGSLGSLKLGPTTTDEGSKGYAVTVVATAVPAVKSATVRVQMNTLHLYDDEEFGGATHMALYFHSPGNKLEYRWNNSDATVNDDGEVVTYPLSSGELPSGARATYFPLDVRGPTTLWVHGFTHDDIPWPNPSEFENSLGRAVITFDPAVPASMGRRQIGPTKTDADGKGFMVDLTVEEIPGLMVTGVEVTQAIQHFGTDPGPANSLPLVEGKDTLVRVYLDSGMSASAAGGGQIVGVTGKLVIPGTLAVSITELAPITARPEAQVDREKIDHTLNFLIPGALAKGAFEFMVEAGAGIKQSNTVLVPVRFEPVKPRNIRLLRVEDKTTGGLPTTTDLMDMVSQLHTQFPIATDIAKAIAIDIPATDVYELKHDLSKEEGWSDFMDDLEDLHEDLPAGDFKLYALLPGTIASPLWGGMGSESASVATGFSYAFAHELGHIYGLNHAPSTRCNPDPAPTGIDGSYLPGDGTLGGVGVDVTSPWRTIHPSSTYDLMTYCDPSWIGAYHWRKLFERFKAGSN